MAVPVPMQGAPAQHVMAIYDANKNLLRYIIPDLAEEVDRADELNYYDKKRGEKMLKIPFAQYREFGKTQAAHLDVQAYVSAHA